MRPTPQTPGSITAAAVLLFVYGGLSLLCGVCGSAMTVAVPKNDPGQVKMQAMLDAGAPGHQIVGYISLGVSLFVAVVMLGAGAGVLRWSNIARIIAILAVLIELAVTIGTTIFQVIFVMPVTNRFIAEVLQEQQKKGVPAPPFDLGALMSGTGIATAIVVVLIKLALLVPIVICLNTPAARSAFSGKLGTEPSDEERDRRLRDLDDDDPSPNKPKYPGDTGITDKS